MGKRQPDDAFAEWFRRAMHQRGYPTQGSRAGGATRLAHDAGVSLSAISRVLNKGRRPEVATLIRLAKPLGQTLRELLIRAGYATAEDLPDEGPPPEQSVRERLATDPTLTPAWRAHIVKQYELLQRLSQLDVTPEDAREVDREAIRESAELSPSVKREALEAEEEARGPRPRTDDPGINQPTPQTR